ASANRAFRFPTYTDLYYTTTESHTSDPNLKPEYATTFEAGANFSRGALQINSALYYRFGKGMIDWIRPFATAENPRPKWQSAHADINAMGGDIQAQYAFSNCFLRKVQLSYSGGTQDRKEIEGYDSRYAMDYLKHKIVFGLHHNIYKRLNVSWNALWQDRNGSYALNNEKRYYEAFLVLDARLQWENEPVRVFVDFNNIFDRQYADFGGIIQAGRWIRTGIRLQL
ncbi:MAG: TonB-dependent receptor, partial [Prevotellaceae bacterium]|nr:TonB-dependent receptor [Prevotellaceae bacterium]